MDRCFPYRKSPMRDEFAGLWLLAMIIAGASVAFAWFYIKAVATVTSWL